ncbi:hypothetical protein JKP88DRAFT_303011 [Tribonema minus]|uniref:Uncharacterized protein n=1 Tax=Tribonema minus TaxID=303371 RepID=A0A835ZHR8_9STRA|nr:hypothetical protein JKP88DRAFT_303011 [Tribonema minus]
MVAMSAGRSAHRTTTIRFGDSRRASLSPKAAQAPLAADLAKHLHAANQPIPPALEQLAGPNLHLGGGGGGGGHRGSGGGSGGGGGGGGQKRGGLGSSDAPRGAVIAAPGFGAGAKKGWTPRGAAIPPPTSMGFVPASAASQQQQQHHHQPTPPPPPRSPMLSSATVAVPAPAVPGGVAVSPRRPATHLW